MKVIFIYISELLISYQHLLQNLKKERKKERKKKQYFSIYIEPVYRIGTFVGWMKALIGVLCNSDRRIIIDINITYA
ncbi:hypothetical protein [Candidatus Azobacteroides pseudotrichonymphae]|uniref:hypothetical protein n=1 Tax=Candidatus Azobacteroides pseudotrichonymphae TaxID=511435 RepID=UPI00223C5A27|nr:hypothetical protein [Candidatus Azobacteroides pseudotrichonymphae]